MSKTTPLTIIAAPHPSLRSDAKAITHVDKKVYEFVRRLETTLKESSRRGVGLAAPQVDKPWRVFATYIGDDGEDRDPARRQLKHYLNPRITRHSASLTLGDDPEQPLLEGCLSIPSLYGPVPRFEWIEIEYQSLGDDALVERKARFTDFMARLVQHEIDHLNGILFTDYVLEYDFPLYRENPDTGKLKEMSDKDRSVIELF